MEEILKQLLEGQKQIVRRMDKMESDISSLRNGQQELINRVTVVESDMATKTHQNENSGFVQALIARIDHIAATIDGQTLSTAKAFAEHGPYSRRYYFLGS